VNISMSVIGCPSCFEPLYAPNPCLHRQRYLWALEFVASRGITIEQPDRADFAWKPADSFTYGPKRYIRISSIGFAHYGWDVLTSVLIHEYAHCDLFLQGIEEMPGMTWDEKLELEKLANARALEITPKHLISEDFEKHREFFLRSYREQGWSEEKTIEEWTLYRLTL
jgi:hypothetical protein